MASSTPLCISADSHVVESAEFFQPLAKRFGDKAPRMVTVDPDKGPQLDLGNGKLGIGLSGFFMADVDFTRPDIAELYRKGYGLARPGCYDVAERLKDQDLDGVDAEVLYPSVLFNAYQIENLDIVKATFSLYNDWTADYCSDAKDRLFGLACVQLFDLDEAIQEMERSKKLGHVGLCIPATAPPDKLYSDPYYDKFWAAAEELQMPLTMHIFTGATPNHGLPFRQAGSPLAFAGVMFTIADLIQGQVLQRFPGLKFVITEFESGWAGIMLKRLDWNWTRGNLWKQGLREKPSFYWKRNFYVTFEDDALGIRQRDVIGSNTLMWGSDYPHGDSVFPHSKEVLNSVLAECTPQERYEMTVKNVVELYNLPFELTGPDQARVNQALAGVAA
jgi:predicted TIM-barrel fold metal-dependent hydrolase